MKRTLLAVALLAVTGAASAAPSLTWTEASEAAPPLYNALFNPDSGITYAGTSFASPANISLGKLSAAGATSGAKVTYTYLGNEAGYSNIFFAPTSTQQWQINAPGAPSIGSSVTTTIAGNGDLDFKFEGAANYFAINGGVWSNNSSIGLIKENYNYAGYGASFAGAGTYAFVIGYNDSFVGHNDWDDMIIGVNIAPIPEPETYAMLLAGLGLMGFVARRRKQSATQA